MRQRSFAALMILTLLLTACSGRGDENRVSDFCQTLRESAAACTAEVSSDAGTFTLSCAEEADAAMIEVLAPDLIAGVTARVGADLTLRFDGLILPIPQNDETVSPLTALPLLLETLRTGHLDLVWREGDALIAQIIPRDDLALRVWFNDQMQPAYAEFIQNGAAAVRCAITQWNQTEKVTPHESNDPNLGGDQSQHPGT